MIASFDLFHGTRFPMSSFTSFIDASHFFCYRSKWSAAVLLMRFVLSIWFFLHRSISPVRLPLSARRSSRFINWI